MQIVEHFRAVPGKLPKTETQRRLRNAGNLSWYDNANRTGVADDVGDWGAGDSSIGVCTLLRRLLDGERRTQAPGDC